MSKRAIKKADCMGEAKFCIRQSSQGVALLLPGKGWRKRGALKIEVVKVIGADPGGRAV
jgi:hypothetical protein